MFESHLTHQPSLTSPRAVPVGGATGPCPPGTSIHSSRALKPAAESAAGPAAPSLQSATVSISRLSWPGPGEEEEGISVVVDPDAAWPRTQLAMHSLVCVGCVRRCIKIPRMRRRADLWLLVCCMAGFQTRVDDDDDDGIIVGMFVQLGPKYLP